MNQSQNEVPDEFRYLGEFRHVFTTTAGAVAASAFSSLIPFALGIGLIVLAEYWIVNRNWKYYLVFSLGILLAFQGLLLIVRTLFRLRQKVIIFEKGIAIWRSGKLATYRWDQIEQVEAVVAKAQGAPSSFLSFSFQGRTEDGESRTYKFHPAGDPIPNLKGMWKVIEEEAGRGRTASVIAALQAGEAVTFQRNVWGTIVSTQIGISLFGIRVKPRYDDARFLDWSRVEQISVVGQPTAPQDVGYTSGGISHLEVLQKFHSSPWVSELTSEIPGYQALIEAAEYARLQFAETIAELHRERLPTALAIIDKGHEFSLGKFGISQNGFRYEAESIPWQDLGYLRFDEEEMVSAALGNRTFAYDSTKLSDRWLLQMVAQIAQYDHDYPTGESVDEEPLNDERE